MQLAENLANVQDQPLYDTQKVPASATTAITFFGTGLGGGTSAYGSFPKTLADTNLRGAGGLLPSPQKLVVKGVAVTMNPQVSLADARLIVNSGVFVFTVGQKNFLECPIEYVMAGWGVLLQAVEDTTAATSHMQVSGGQALPSAFRVLGKTITLTSTESFSISVQWPGSGITVATESRLKCYLLGDFYRAVQ